MHDWEGAEQMEMIYNWILKLSFFAVLGSVTDSGGNAGCTGTGIV